MEASEIMNTLGLEIQHAATEETVMGYLPRKFTVDEYYRMGEVGMINDNKGAC